MLIALHKPYGVLSQFTSDGGHPTLADHVDVPGVYPAGRLDHDSEGLLLLTDDGRLQHAIADPDKGFVKRYLAQVEGIPTPAALARFRTGLAIGEGAARFRARPATAVAVPEPDVAPRTTPVRYRASIPSSWIEVTVSEGRNRQVRRMTAAVGHPTLRLIRVGIGPVELFALGLGPGEWCTLDVDRLAPGARPLQP